MVNPLLQEFSEYIKDIYNEDANEENWKNLCNKNALSSDEFCQLIRGVAERAPHVMVHAAGGINPGYELWINDKVRSLVMAEDILLAYNVVANLEAMNLENFNAITKLAIKAEFIRLDSVAPEEEHALNHLVYGEEGPYGMRVINDLASLEGTSDEDEDDREEWNRRRDVRGVAVGMNIDSENGDDDMSIEDNAPGTALGVPRAHHPAVNNGRGGRP